VYGSIDMRCSDEITKEDSGFLAKVQYRGCGIKDQTNVTIYTACIEHSAWLI